MKYALGIDIGGTKIATVIIDQDYNIIERVEVESITTNEETMFDQVVKSINLVLSKSKLSTTEISGVGVGVPGKVDPKYGIAIYQNNIPWEGFPIVARLKEQFPFENIRIDNDVYLATLAEWTIAGASNDDTFVYITVSTGVSCASMHKGEFIRGAGFAGEIGLIPVKSAIATSEFERLERATSGPTIEKVAQHKFRDNSIIPRDVFQRYQAGDETAIQLIQSVSKSLAYSVYSIICLLDPQKIVFGGGVANNNPFLIDLIREELEKYVIEEQKESLERLAISHFKGNSGVIGAGILGYYS